MPFTTATETELAGRATAIAEASAKPGEVDYPERNWIAQSIAHGDAVLQAAAALRNHFRDRTDVLVAMELAVYYRRNDNNLWLQPDVQVVFGVSPENRSSYRIWEEGKAPDFVLEVASPSTAENDAEHKAGEYARIGVREYWRLDPDGTLMGSALARLSLRPTRLGSKLRGHTRDGVRAPDAAPLCGRGRRMVA